MPDEPKKYRATLKGHSEEWTQPEYDAVKALLGARFGEYEVQPLQPAKPAELPVKAASAAKPDDKKDQPAA